MRQEWTVNLSVDCGMMKFKEMMPKLTLTPGPSPAVAVRERGGEAHEPG
jgi:hypothetical protein